MTKYMYVCVYIVMYNYKGMYMVYILMIALDALSNHNGMSLYWCTYSIHTSCIDA